MEKQVKEKFKDVKNRNLKDPEFETPRIYNSD